MTIEEIVSFITPKKVYDKPEDYVYARRHRFDNMWSRPAKNAKPKKNKRKSK